MKVLIRIIVMTMIVLILNACVKPGGVTGESIVAPESFPPPTAPDSPIGNARTDVLIYGGPGSWKDEIAALKAILYSHGSTYEEILPTQLNQLSVEDFQKYRVILFAGGDAPTVRKALSTETHARLREAVQKNGLSYLGFCAGAWLAVAPAPLSNEDVTYGLGVVNGPLLETNYLGKQGHAFGLDKTSLPDGSIRKLLWYGGPITPDIPGGVIAKYADGTPAISQIWSGKGLVIISGLHPAANKLILSKIGILDREAIAPDFAWTLLQGAIQQKPLPAF